MCEPAGATATPDARGPRDGCRASAARSPGERWSVRFPRCPAPARAKRRTRWKRLPENCVTASKEAVETPGGGRDRLSSSDAPRHRRVASRSGGATSGECDGRPVERRVISDAVAAGSEATRTSDSCAWYRLRYHSSAEQPRTRPLARQLPWPEIGLPTPRDLPSSRRRRTTV